MVMIEMDEKYRVIDGFDYKNKPCKLIEDIETEERYSTENDLEANSLCKLLNEQEEKIQQLKWSNKILRANKKDCEFGRREERKRWKNMDKMRIEHIRLLQKRLKKNGLSIYIYGDD